MEEGTNAVPGAGLLIPKEEIIEEVEIELVSVKEEFEDREDNTDLILPDVTYDKEKKKKKVLVVPKEEPTSSLLVQENYEACVMPIKTELTLSKDVSEARNQLDMQDISSVYVEVKLEPLEPAPAAAAAPVQASSSDKGEFLTSNRGHTQLKYRGYRYSPVKADRGKSTMRWYCTSHKHLGCKAALVARRDTVVNTVAGHHHAPAKEIFYTGNRTLDRFIKFIGKRKSSGNKLM